MREAIGKILVFLMILIAAGFVSIATQNNDQETIRAWASQHSYEIKEINYCSFALGPYYIKDDDHRIYEVKLHNHRTYWFRFGMFSYDVEEYGSD